MHLSDITFMRKFLFLAGFLTSFSFAALGQTQLIQDGDFESPIFSPPWNASPGVTVPSDTGARSPTHYLSLGHTVGLQLAYQTINLPTNTIAAALYYYYNIISPGASAVDQFHAVIRRTDGSLLATVDSRTGLNFDQFQIPPVYHPIAFDLTPYAGQAIRISFEALDDVTGSGTAFNIDDVSVWVETTADIPPNDYFTNRTVITNNSAVKFGTNIFATKEPGEPNHAGNQGGKSLWWTWTAPTAIEHRWQHLHYAARGLQWLFGFESYEVGRRQWQR